MKLFSEWLDEKNGYHLFMGLYEHPDATTAMIFCDWLDDENLPKTAEWMRHNIDREHLHGYWNAMASELSSQGIEFGDSAHNLTYRSEEHTSELHSLRH